MKLIPSSRRFKKNEWHPYGWEVAFYQTIEFSDGHRMRMRFSDIGVNYQSALGNALRQLSQADAVRAFREENSKP